ncbi:MAG: hypothetical protein OXJ64_21105, partial [Boseongicola sp.]|nr:hypothetical protein [Boseongicola sp.]
MTGDAGILSHGDCLAIVWGIFCLMQVQVTARNDRHAWNPNRTPATQKAGRLGAEAPRGRRMAAFARRAAGARMRGAARPWP